MKSVKEYFNASKYNVWFFSTSISNIGKINKDCTARLLHGKGKGPRLGLRQSLVKNFCNDEK